MTIKPRHLLLGALLIFGSKTAVFAEGEPLANPPGGGPQHQRGERPKMLTDEERERLKAAAMAARQDPAVQAAFKNQQAAGTALRDAVRAAILKNDPTLGPVLDKVGDRMGELAARMEGGRRPGQFGPNSNRPDRGPGSAPNPDEGNKPDGKKPDGNKGPDGAKMKELQEKVQNDPELSAAREKMKSATTPEEKEAAKDNFRKLVKAKLGDQFPGPRGEKENGERREKMREQLKNDPEVQAAHEKVENAKTPEEKEAAQDAMRKLIREKVGNPGDHGPGKGPKAPSESKPAAPESKPDMESTPADSGSTMAPDASGSPSGGRPQPFPAGSSGI